MSFLRLLSSSKLNPFHPSSVSKSNGAPILTLHVPSYGGVYLGTPADPHDPSAHDDVDSLDPDPILRGELEVELPKGSGRKRCQSIRVGLETISRLDVGPDGRTVEGILFEREMQLDADDKGGLWLEEGSQRFDITIIIPNNLAAHDWHPNGTISHNLYAVVEGMPPAVSDSRRSPVRIASTLSLTQSMSSDVKPGTTIGRHFSNNPQTPSYDAATSEDWLRGIHSVKRTIMLFYNPQRHGGLSTLDDRSQGSVEGIGVWHMHLFSDEWSVGGIMQARLELTSLTPAMTIFAIRLLLRQKHTMTSPRGDSEAVETTAEFVIASDGQRPPSVEGMSKKWPVLWEGPARGVSQIREFEAYLKGRIPDDLRARPTTLPGVQTPIVVTHTVVAEVYFTLEVDNLKARKVMRMMTVKRPITLPSCVYVPNVVNLPLYNNCSDGTPCGDKAVTPRMPPGPPEWHFCACGMSIDKMEERIRSVKIEEQADEGSIMSNKVRAERRRLGEE